MHLQPFGTPRQERCDELKSKQRIEAGFEGLSLGGGEKYMEYRSKICIMCSPATFVRNISRVDKYLASCGQDPGKYAVRFSDKILVILIRLQPKLYSEHEKVLINVPLPNKNVSSISSAFSECYMRTNRGTDE
jgi:hypothetical protein